MVRYVFKCNGETIVLSEYFCEIPDSTDSFYQHTHEIWDKEKLAFSEKSLELIQGNLRELDWDSDRIKLFEEILRVYYSCSSTEVDFDDYIYVSWTFDYDKFRKKLHEFRFQLNKNKIKCRIIEDIN